MSNKSLTIPIPSTHGGGRIFLEKLGRLAAVCLVAVYTLGFIFFRIAEIAMCFFYYSRECASALIGTIILHRSLNLRGKITLHILSMIVLVYFLDNYIPKPLPPPPLANDDANSFSSKTIVITGANAGIGYEVSRLLAVNYGMQVIMGCRSESRCQNAANAIRAEIAATTTTSAKMKSQGKQGSVNPMLIDLSNLDSVQTFASQLKGRQIDTLFNNAGWVPTAGIPVNSYGLDPSFTSMHLSHFFLTELLLAMNPSMRVINTSSGTHHICALPFAYLPPFILQRNLISFPQSHGCINEEYLQNGIRSETDGAAYIQAKLANVMHAVEISRRHPRASVSVAIDLGWVGTTIQSFMVDTLFVSFGDSRISLFFIPSLWLIVSCVAGVCIVSSS
jgi:NAD(P)-dependent dehydrogenase (short-subunit alcohol dehydrogenase family)